MLYTQTQKTNGLLNFSTIFRYFSIATTQRKIIVQRWKIIQSWNYNLNISLDVQENQNEITKKFYKMTDVEGRYLKNRKKCSFFNYCVTQGNRLPSTKIYKSLSSLIFEQIHIWNNFLWFF